MHPALSTRIDLIKRKKALLAEFEANTADVEAAIALGEIKFQGNSYKEDGLHVQRVDRTTYKYSPAVEAMREQEIMEGVAQPTKTSALRFVYKDVQ